MSGVVKEPSTIATFLPSAVSAAPMLMTMLVLPTPPFPELTIIALPIPVCLFINSLFKCYAKKYLKECFCDTYMNAIYMYGIVDGRFTQVFECKGIGVQSDVTCVPFKDVTAIVSRTPFVEYMPSEENMLAHESVMQEVINKGGVIAPMRFCTIVKNRGDMMRLLHEAYYQFKRNVLRIRDKHEFSVKVFVQEQGFTDVVEESKVLATELYGLLKSIAHDVVLEELITDDMMLNCSLLVHRERVEGMRKAIVDFDRGHTEKVRIRISGPTAPYNFVDMLIA
jgi:hypothetical protein